MIVLSMPIRSWNSVRTNPGHNAITATPLACSSIDDVRAGAALDHRQDGGVGEPEDRPDQQVELLLLDLDRVRPEWLLLAEAGVVHQYFDRPGAEPLLDRRELLRLGQIRRQHLTRHSEPLGELRGDLLQSRLVPRDQDQVVPVAGQLVRKGSADPGSWSSDERRRHSFTPPVGNAASLSLL